MRWLAYTWTFDKGSLLDTKLRTPREPHGLFGAIAGNLEVPPRRLLEVEAAIVSIAEGIKEAISVLLKI
jgi:hypothetical protein